MTYWAAIAICVVSISPRDCQHNTATDWMLPPEPQQGLAECMIYGETYAAKSNLVIEGKTYPKVWCQPQSSISNGNVG